MLSEFQQLLDFLEQLVLVATNMIDVRLSSFISEKWDDRILGLSRILFFLFFYLNLTELKET